MFDSLSSKLQGILTRLRGEGRVSERHLEASLREIRMALLEADVHFKVVKQLLGRIREKALGEEVLRSLTPGQQVVKIVRDELVVLLGGQAPDFKLPKSPPSVVLMVGLQGSGKTTSTGKLALWCRNKGHQPVMVSTDTQRPAAREQLSAIGKQLEIAVFNPSEGSDPVAAVEQARRHAGNRGFEPVLIDTAGRLHIDEELMAELVAIQNAAQPQEVLLVADSMTGQDAVNSALAFSQRLDLTGVILSKLDGDARGGAALSIRSVTGQPIKFVGLGEHYDALELFQPDRMAGRILGMGDMLGLIEKAEQSLDLEQAQQMVERMQRQEFTLEDFRGQLNQIQRLGSFEQILEMLPGNMAPKGLAQMQVGEKDWAHMEAIINSMTPRERTHYKILNGSRRKRIARGSGRPVAEVNRLIKQYQQVKTMMARMNKGFFARKLRKFNFSV